MTCPTCKTEYNKQEAGECPVCKYGKPGQQPRLELPRKIPRKIVKEVAMEKLRIKPSRQGIGGAKPKQFTCHCGHTGYVERRRKMAYCERCHHRFY